MPHRIFQRHLFASTSLHSGNRKWLGFGTVGFAAVTAGYWYWQTKKQEAYPQTVQEPLRKALIQRHRQAEPSRILHYFNEAIQASLNMDSSSRARTALWVEVGDYYRDLASQTNVVQRKNQLLGKTVQLYHGAWKGNAEALMSKGTKDSNDDDDILERSVVTAMKLGQALEQSQGDNEAEKMYEWAIQAVLQRVINSDDGLKRYIEVLLPCLDAMVQLFKKQKRFALAKETLSEMWEIVKNETSENCRSSSIAIEAAAVESELRNFSDAKNWLHEAEKAAKSSLSSPSVWRQWTSAFRGQQDSSCHECLCAVLVGQGRLEEMDGNLSKARTYYGDAFSLAKKEKLEECLRQLQLHVE